MFANGVMESIVIDHVCLEVCHFDDKVVVLSKSNLDCDNTSENITLGLAKHISLLFYLFASGNSIIMLLDIPVFN